MARASQTDNVGPFTLGMVQPGIGSEKPMKKWSELDVKGKGESAYFSVRYD